MGKVLERIVYFLFMLVILASCTVPRSDLASVKSNSAPCCNVLLITLDTVRADHLQCYGYERNTAPRMCSLAKQGILFEKAMTQSSWTLPAHASIMTGVYPHEHGAENFEVSIDDNLPMLAEILKNNNYSTSAFVSVEFVSEKYGFDKGFDVFDSTSIKKEDLVLMGSFAKDLTQSAMHWLEQNDQKFFMWIHYFDPHNAFLYHNTSGFAYPKAINYTLRWREFEWDWNVVPCPFCDYFEENEEQYISLYDGEIFFVDSYVGKLLDYLKQEGLFDNTIIIITSDHGESFNNHDLVGHDNFLYADLIHVPLIMFVPNTQPYRDDKLTETKDILPTVLDLLNISKPARVGDGFFIGNLTYAFSEVHNRNENRRIAVNHEDWKLIYTLNDRYFELYDLEDDPDELNNLAESKPEMVKKLREPLFRTMRVVDLDEETLKQLKSLGYT